MKTAKAGPGGSGAATRPMEGNGLILPGPGTSIRLYHAALDDHPASPTGLVIRGVVDNRSWANLRVDDYQREAQPLTSLKQLISSFPTGQNPPDIEIGMRGQSFSEIAPGMFDCHNPCFVVDGLQRTTACLAYLKMLEAGMLDPHMGATLHFETDKEWERERFRILNLFRYKMAPAIMLRNMKEKNLGILTLYGISQDANGPLYDRVCWDQMMKKTQLVTAMTYAATAGILHNHIRSARSPGVEGVAESLSVIATRIGLALFRRNVEEFFGLIDGIWGIRNVTYKIGAIYLRRTFLETLARVMSDHFDFWTGKEEREFKVPYNIKRKLHGFPMKDPEVQRLAAATGQARQVLYHMVIDFINSGKRANRMRHRSGGTPNPSHVTTKVQPEDHDDIDPADLDDGVIAAQ